MLKKLKIALSCVVCLALLFSCVPASFAQTPGSSDDVITEAAKTLVDLHDHMNDPADFDAIRAARNKVNDLTAEKWNEILQPITSISQKLEDNKQDLIDMTKDLANIFWSDTNSQQVLENQLRNYKEKYTAATQDIFGNDFDLVDCYTFLLGKDGVTDQIPGVIVGNLGDLISSPWKDIENKFQEWVNDAITEAMEAQPDFAKVLQSAGVSREKLIAVKDSLIAAADPNKLAEGAFARAYIRTQAVISFDAAHPVQNDSCNFVVGETVPVRLDVLNFPVEAFLNWASNNNNVVKFNRTYLEAVGAGTAQITAYRNDINSEWVARCTIKVTTKPSEGGAGPSRPPAGEPVQDIQDKLESGEATPVEAAKDLAEHLASLAPEKITEELKTQVLNLVKAIIEKAGTVTISPEQITTTDNSATVTVGAEAIAAALANLDNVHKTLTGALDKAKITGISLARQVVLTVPPEVAAKPEVVVQIPAQSLTDLSNAGAALVVRPSDAVAIVFPVIQAQSAALGLLVASAGSSWLNNLIGSAENPTVQVKTRTLDSLETARLTGGLPATATERMTLAGKIVEVDVTTAAGKYTKPVRLLLNYDPTKVKDSELLGAYTYDEAAGNWRYIDGKVDEAGKAVDVTWAGFDQYAVMEYNRTFADAISHWARREIKVMAARHLVAGVSQEDFAPDRQITRAEFAVILARMMNLTADPAGAERFADIPAGAWYRGMVGAAAKAGLVAGMSQNTFAPDELITREQMAAMIARLLKKQKGLAITEAEANQTLASFQDAAAVSAWAKLDVALMAKESIMNGREAAKFVPAGKSTRAEATVVLYRVLEKI